MIAIPDQWHAIVATEAAARKKDIYGEKPLARTIAEQQAIVKAVQKNQVIWQTGSWQHSLPAIPQSGRDRPQRPHRNSRHTSRSACPAVIMIFPAQFPRCSRSFRPFPTRSHDPAQIVPGTPAWDLAVTEPPADFDYERWIGPSRMEPYIEARVYQNWRWNYNTGGGQLMDWIGHHGDIAHWGMGFDLSGPSEVEGHGEFPAANAVWNTATSIQWNARIGRKSRSTPPCHNDDRRWVYRRSAWAQNGLARKDGCGSIAAVSMRPIPNGQRRFTSRRFAQGEVVRIA